MPVVISGFTLRIPILAHESDAALGLANRIALPFVTKIAVGFETENYPKIPINKIIYTGNPIRKKITNAKNYSKVECRKLLKIKLDHPLILIIGGSQGAASLNKIIFEDLPKILSKYYLIHLTGVGDYEKALSLQKKIKNKGWYHPFDFVTEELGYMLKAADLVISRAGANTITELAYLERPTILVPLMGAAGEHQMKNAQALSSQAATFIFDQKKEGPERLIEKIQEILNDEKLQKKLAQNIYRFADEQASTRIAEQVLKIAKK